MPYTVTDTGKYVEEEEAEEAEEAEVEEVDERREYGEGRASSLISGRAFFPFTTVMSLSELRLLVDNV